MSHPAPERLALAALPPETPDPATLAHLAACADCRAHIEALRCTVELARAGGDVDDDGPAPPPRVWEAIARETGVEPRAAAGSVRPLPSRPRWRRYAVAAAALAVGLAGGLGLGLALDPAPAPEESVVALPAVPGSVASGSVGVRDDAGTRELVIDLACPAGPGGDYLEAWLMDPGGTRLVALGALTPQPDGRYRGTFAVPAGLPTAEFGVVDVSAERWDGDPAHSGASLVRGPLPPA